VLSLNINIPDFVKALKPYKSGNSAVSKTDEAAFKSLINLASNENPLGASPKALSAIRNGLEDIAIYPDPRAELLVDKIATSFGINPDCIVTGSGSDSLIAYIINACTIEDDEVLTAEGTFIGTFVNVNKLGRTLKTVPLKDYAFDLQAIADAVNPKTKIIYLANPNNPTGTMFSKDELDGFLQQVPDNILVILDEAYHLYAYEFPNYPDGLNYFGNNVIVLRTFSKSYGLAGIRVGYALGDAELISYIRKVKLPFEPNYLAQIAAIGAIDDIEFLEKTKELNKIELERLKAYFDKKGLKYAPPTGNFLMVLFEDEEKAENFTQKSLERGVITRRLPAFGIPNGVRINTGTEEQMNRAFNVFDYALSD